MTVQIENISKRYGDKTVLGDFSLTVKDGELLTLIGPSGCGKSTLLKIIAGIVPQNEGRIVLHGEDISHTPAHLRGAVLVFQNFHLFPHLTVAENIGFGLKMRGEKKEVIQEVTQEMLSLVQLNGLGEKRPHQISGGQQQRTALARALAVKPKLLLLDEPFSNLDPALRAQMRTLLAELQRKLSITTLLVTHDKEEAMLLSDRIAVLLKHRPEQVGTPEEIYHHPRTKAVADYFGRAAYLEGIVTNGVLETEFYRLPVEAPDGPVRVLIRPEDVYPDDRGVPYRVVSREYLGDSCLYTLLHGVTTISMRTHPQIRHEEGEMVPVCVQPQNPVFFSIT